MKDTIAQEIRGFIVENFLLGESNDGLKDTHPFLESGIIDSTNCLLSGFANQVHLEKHYYHPYAMEMAELVREGDRRP